VIICVLAIGWTFAIVIDSHETSSSSQ
jgi:hypothetical protein